MIWLIVPLLYFLVNPVSIVTIKTKCTDCSLMRSYSLSSSLTALSTCKPANCLLQSQISVIERDHFDEYLNFTLISYGISEEEVRSIGLQLTKPVSSNNPTSSNTLYSCTKLRSGLTSAKVTIETYSQTIGSSIYLNGNLYCSWIASRNDAIWPIDNSQLANLVEDKGYQIYLQLNGSTINVANDSTNLPIYQRQYLKNCCQYRILGNTNYKLISKRSTNGQSTDFMLQFIDSSPNVMQLILKQSNGTSLIVECSFTENLINFYSIIGTETQYLTSTLTNRKIYQNRCSWTLPDVLVVNKRLTIKPDSTIFKTIQIVVDRLSVYSESNVALIGFSFKIASNLLIVTLSIIFSLSIQ